MIFPTLEGLTVQEQEEHERRQLMDHGRMLAPRERKPQPPRAPRGAPRWTILLTFMQPGVEYPAAALIAACGLRYPEIRIAMDRGVITRSGTRKLYRFKLAEKVEQREAVPA